MYFILYIHTYTLALSPMGVANINRDPILFLFAPLTMTREPAPVWALLLVRHSPPSLFSLVFHKADSPTAPTTRLPVVQPRGSSRCLSELRHFSPSNHSSGNDAGLGPVWTLLLVRHSPPSLFSLVFNKADSPTAATT